MDLDDGFKEIQNRGLNYAVDDAMTDQVRASDSAIIYFAGDLST